MIDKLKGFKRRLIEYELQHPFLPFVSALCVSLTILVVVFGICKYNEIKESERKPVQFSDRELERIIRSKCKKTKIYPEDLEKLTELTIEDDLELKNIEDIKKCKNLTKLVITGCNVDDISVIGELEDIQSVDFSGNRILNVEGIDDCTTLQEVILDSNKISDIEPLYRLKELKRLSVSENNISKLSENVLQLENLEYLNVSCNRLIDIDNLDGLVKLTELCANGNKISRCPELQHLPRLTTLYLENNSLCEMEVAGEFSSVEELGLSGNYLSDLQFLGFFPRLKKLCIGYNEFTDLEGVLQCGDLEYLDIRGTKIKDVSVLTKLERFNSIYVDDDFDRTQLDFMVDHFRNCDYLTKEYLLKMRYDLS